MNWYSRDQSRNISRGMSPSGRDVWTQPEVVTRVCRDHILGGGGDFTTADVSVWLSDAMVVPPCENRYASLIRYMGWLVDSGLVLDIGRDRVNGHVYRGVM